MKPKDAISPELAAFIAQVTKESVTIGMPVSAFIERTVISNNSLGLPLLTELLRGGYVSSAAVKSRLFYEQVTLLQEQNRLSIRYAAVSAFSQYVEAAEAMENATKQASN